MIGPILLIVSWLLLRLEGKRLDALGFNEPKRRSLEFGLSFLLAGVVAAAQQLGLSAATAVPWKLNPSADAALILHSIRWNLNSVLFEEFIFRGYLLYQAIRWLGIKRGVLLGASAFGIYHWFSYGVFGNPAMMLFIFLFTGAFGLMLALAFAKTQSLAAPIGLHLGWNFVSYLGFSTGPLGAALLVPADGAPKMNATGLSSFLLNLALPVLFTAGMSWYLTRTRLNQTALAESSHLKTSIEK